jgi:hypothetical protein
MDSFSENDSLIEEISESASDQSQQRLEQEKESWEKAERFKRLFLIVFLAVLLLITLIAFYLNAVAISRASIQPFALDIVHNLGESNFTYAVFVDWEGMPESSAPRPFLLINDSKIATNEQQAIELGAARLSKSIIEVVIPYGAQAGMHKGTLCFIKRSGASEFPSKLTVPLAIDVSASLWSDWRLLRTWCIGLFVIYAASWMTSLAIYPKPHGFLSVLDCNDPWANVPAQIPIKQSGFTWLMPWQRSSVPLRQILIKGRIKTPMPSGVYLVFNFGSGRLPTMVIAPRYRGRFMSINDGGDLCCDIDRDLLWAFGTMKPMAGERFVYGQRDGSHDIIFEFKTKQSRYF